MKLKKNVFLIFSCKKNAYPFSRQGIILHMCLEPPPPPFRVKDIDYKALMFMEKDLRNDILS